jgi:hypothetical protein
MAMIDAALLIDALAVEVLGVMVYAIYGRRNKKQSTKASDEKRCSNASLGGRIFDSPRLELDSSYIQ